MKLGIYTIEKTLYDGEVKEIIAKTTSGDITVLPGHIPLVTELKNAPIKIIEESGKEISIDIESGFLEVEPEDIVVVLVSSN